MLARFRQRQRQSARLVAGLFVWALAMSAAAPCVMATPHCPGMAAEHCPKLLGSESTPCQGTQLIDCKQPKSNTAADLVVQVLAPLPVTLALVPIARLLSGDDAARIRSRYQTNLPPPPPNLRNAILLI